MIAREVGGLKGLENKVKGLKSTNWQLQNSQRDEKYNIRNIVSNSVIILIGARWVLELLGGSLYKSYKCLTTVLYT